MPVHRTRMILQGITFPGAACPFEKLLNALPEGRLISDLFQMPAQHHEVVLRQELQPWLRRAPILQISKSCWSSPSLH